MKKNFIFFLLFIFCIQSFGCKEKISADEKARKWFEETKKEIELESDIKKCDSVTVRLNADSSIRRDYYKNGNVFFWYNKSIFGRGVKKYSLDTKFSLNREFDRNDSMRFEGIAYNGRFYGLSTWYHPNGKVAEQGVRFTIDTYVGIWNYYDSTGKLIKSIDYKNLDKLDSMPMIKNISKKQMTIDK
ncbi:MAG: hypothetical protein RL708_1562 [Bacteroidota bacterium]|jgi:antitoxin component YwqK of YwqJK toxin-antitoxin module